MKAVGLVERRVAAIDVTVASRRRRPQLQPGCPASPSTHKAVPVTRPEMTFVRDMQKALLALAMVKALNVQFLLCALVSNKTEHTLSSTVYSPDGKRTCHLQIHFQKFSAQRLSATLRNA